MFSVIIPIYACDLKSVELLRGALRQLKRSSFQDFEVLVADDASPAASAIADAVAEAGAGLVRLEQRSGPAIARNAAAARAIGEILVFMDADTSAHADTLDRFAREFESHPELDAVVGSYDQEPSAAGTVSRFRNLLHSFVHHRANRRASTFWAGCGAVRRSRFLALGGFNESFPRPSIEDVEFGLRLRAAGGAIALDPRIQVTHHKAWTLRSMVSTDLFARAIPWTLLIRRYPLPLDLNFTVSDRISAALACLTLPLILIALIHSGAWRLAPLLALALIGLLNAPLFRFLARRGGWGFALRSFPLLLAYFGACAAGLIGGLALAEHRRDRFLWPAAGAIALVLLTLQIVGGAFTAEFDGHPDEAAQFVSGLLVYDYLTTLPRENPIAWAGQYYIHYPKVAIGHWPPGYAALEALWWLLVGPSRVTAMLLHLAIGVLALTALYRLSRSYLSLLITAGIIAFTIAAPVFQWSLEMTMADLCCLLCGVICMQASVRLMEQGDRLAWVLVVLSLSAAALIKGTAVCLAPVPVVALLASGRRIRIPVRWLMVGGVTILAMAAWYLSIGGIRALGAIGTGMTWASAIIWHLAGWGFLALAAFGLGWKPLPLVAGSLVVSTLGVSYVVRAMQEDRHAIFALPAILILAGFAITRIRTPLIAVIVLAPAVALFPYSWYRPPQSAYGDLLRQLHRPARMLVSSDGIAEGAWIAVASLAERRPGSLIARASKVLSEQGWSGAGYRLTTHTPQAVSRRLDDLALDTVVVHTSHRPEATPPHHAILKDLLSHSAAWTSCGSAFELVAYCRVKPPEFPRQPLRLRVHGWNFEERIVPSRLP